MSKDPSPKADAQRALGQANYARKKKLIPYAGQERLTGSRGGSIPYSKNPKAKKT